MQLQFRSNKVVSTLVIFLFFYLPRRGAHGDNILYAPHKRKENKPPFFAFEASTNYCSDLVAKKISTKLTRFYFVHALARCCCLYTLPTQMELHYTNSSPSDLTTLFYYCSWVYLLHPGTQTQPQQTNGPARNRFSYNGPGKLLGCIASTSTWKWGLAL